MLNKIKTRLTKNNQHPKESNEYNLSIISNNFFPYSCLVDDDVLLTKNGELLQTIEIKMTDFTKNKDNGIRDAVRKAISNNELNSQTAFWIHTIKRKKDSNTKANDTNISKNFFLQKVSNVIDDIKQGLNRYDIITYITIVQDNKSVNTSPFEALKNTINFIGNSSSSLQTKISLLKENVSHITQQLQDYNPHILSIRIDEEEKKYSELMEFLYFLVNHKQKEIEIEQVDITDEINESSYLFKDGKMLFKNNNTGDINVASIFTIKEIQNFTISTIADIINNIDAEMIITEYIDSIDKKTANNFINSKNDFIKQKDNNTSFNDQEQYYQSSISVLVFDDISNKNNTTDVFLRCANTFAEKGIVVVREDIGLERSYYAMMPANFYFTYRLSIHDKNEIGTFIYSYVFQEKNSNIFIKNLSLLNIGTLKNNPVQIGFLKENSNVLISGPEKCGTGIVANLLTSAWESKFNSNIIYVELNKESSMFIDAIGGKNYRISADPIKNNTQFNLLNFKSFQDTQEIQTYLSNMLSLMIGVDNTIIDTNFTNNINSALDIIMEHCLDGNNDSSTLSKLHPYLKSNNIDEMLRHWYLIGKYYHLFDNKNDVFDNIDIAHFYIDDTIKNKTSLLSVVVYHLFTSIVNFARKNDKPTIVVVDEPFVLFSDTSFSKILEYIEDVSQETDTHFIFKIHDFEREMMSSTNFGEIVKSCGLQMHFANKDIVNNNYMRIFQLNKQEYTTINALSKFDGINFFVKYLDERFCCQLNIADKKVLSILSDPDSYTYNNIINIKNSTMNYDPNSYIAQYFSISNI